MTSVAVMQPTWLPWCGYFDLMDRVDHFVLLDDVEFSYQSWQHRNRIQTRDGLRWLTIPVSKSDRFRPINDVHIADRDDAATRMANQLREAYRASEQIEMRNKALDLISGVRPRRPLLDVLVAGIELLRNALGVSTPLHFSSDIETRSGRGDRLVDLVRAVEGVHYVTPAGAVGYLEQELDAFDDGGVSISVQGYEHPKYEQLHKPFEPFASALDLTLTVGPPGAGGVMRSGRRPTTDLETAT